ncbi:MAG: hypothetical protein J6P03_06425 [Opitutales bacterium]|nr:hypothetical protein [Opitutales bacterium]
MTHKRLHLRKILSALALSALSAALFAKEEPLTAKTSSGNPAESKNFFVDKKRSVAWTVGDGDKTVYLTPKSGKWPDPTKDGELYLSLTIADLALGKITPAIRTTMGGEIRPDKATYRYMMNTKKWKVIRFKFSNVEKGAIKHIALRAERSWIKADAKAFPEPIMPVASAEISDIMPKDGYFKWLCEETWKRPYSGQTVKAPNNNTLKGKIMAGYQGWFATPNDALNHGWIHWGDPANNMYSVDMWPYMKDYPPNAIEKVHNVKLSNGAPAYLFSSARPEIVMTHFKWMKEYGIDGVFVQRFCGGKGRYATNKECEEWVLGCVREAANRTGRIWAIEWDVSGCNEETLFRNISEDWKWLVDEFGILKDPNYARVDGKPVVYIWGMERRGLPLEESNRIMDFLKNDPKYGGVYFIGGASGSWKRKPDWVETHFKRHDALGIWMHKSYGEDLKDVKELIGENAGYFAHIMPGFSWYNLKHYQSASWEAYTPRRHGEFMQKQIDDAYNAGAQSYFIGMFDEYDESTAVMPMADVAPKTPSRPGVMVYFSEEENRNGEHTPPQELFKKVHLDFSQIPTKRLKSPSNYVSSWNGSIRAPIDAEYTFRLEGAAGDSFFLRTSSKDDPREIKKTPIDEKSYDPSSPREFKIALKKGQLFPFRITYFHKTGSGELKFMWKYGKSKKFQEIPEEAYVDAWGRFINNEGDDPFLYLELIQDLKAKLDPNFAKTVKKKKNSRLKRR